MAIVHLDSKRLQGLKIDRVVDSLGSSADGTNSGVTLIDNKIGTGCAFFDGTGDYAQNTSVTPLGSGDFTISCWIKSTDNEAYNHFISTYNSGSGTNWALLTVSGVVQLYVEGVGNDSSGVTLAENTWYHVCCSKEHQAQ